MKSIFTLGQVMDSADHYDEGMVLTVSLKNETVAFQFIKQGLFEQSKIKHKPSRSAVYCILKCLTGEMYVGSSGDVRNRLLHHKNSLLIGKNPAKKLQASFKCTQAAYFDVCVIFTKDREEAFDVEQVILDHYWQNGKLFNDAKNARVSTEGRIFSEETRRKIGDGTRGKPISQEIIDRIRLSRAGYVHSEETRKKISISNKGRKSSASTIELLKVNNHKRYRPVCINGVNYVGIRVASRALGIDNMTLINRIKSGSLVYKEYAYVS